MAKDHLIWRPNDVASEDWAAMSREDQIAWWKSHQQPRGPKRHMKDVVLFYDGGNITLGDFVSLACKLAAPNEIEEFVGTCPPELLAALKESLATYGEDENRWPRMYQIASYFPWVTSECFASVESGRTPRSG